MPPNGSRQRLSIKSEVCEKISQGGGREVEVLIQVMSESKFLLCLQSITLALCLCLETLKSLVSLYELARHTLFTITIVFETTHILIEWTKFEVNENI